MAGKRADASALLACFETPEQLADAVARCTGNGWPDVDVYTPFPVAGLQRRHAPGAGRVRRSALIVAVLFATCMFLLQWYSAVIDYPYIIAGKPYFSLPAFAVITGVTAMLGAVLGAFFAMLADCRLPRFNHLVFDAEAYGCDTEYFWLLLRLGQAESERASADRCLQDAGAVSTETLSR